MGCQFMIAIALIHTAYVGSCNYEGNGKYVYVVSTTSLEWDSHW